MNQQIDPNYNRTLWRAHRGMLELDLFLIPFVEQAWNFLSAHDKKIFDELLQSTDPELFSWLMGHDVPPNEEFHRLVDQIRQHKSTSI